MNKLLLLFLLSIMILYAQCAGDCQDAEIDQTENDTDEKKATFWSGKKPSSTFKQCVPNAAGTSCEEKTLPYNNGFPGDVKTDDDKKTFCGLSAAENKKCQLNSGKTACEQVGKPETNSGSILYVFKITFTLIIIFIIL